MKKIDSVDRSIVYSETLAQELAQFSIRVLIVEPAAFRTENIFASPSFEGNPIADYDSTREGSKTRLKQIDGTQPGDPVKAMRVLVDVVRGEGVAAGRTTPVVLGLGSDYYRAVKDILEAKREEIEQWREVTVSTDLPPDA